MRSTKLGLNWPALYTTWQGYCRIINPAVLEEPQFLPVQILYMPWHATRNPADWLPKDDMQNIIESYSNPFYVQPYVTKAGTNHTAKLLYASRGDRERQQAIYILASLRDMEKERPENWRNTSHQLRRDVHDAIQDHFPTFTYWHWASRNALPVHILSAQPWPRKLLVPRIPEDLLYIAALEVAINVATWQFVEYIYNPSPSLQGDI